MLALMPLGGRSAPSERPGGADMAGHARYTALLDACVLFPVAVCDSLMSVAATGLYAPKWTQRIEDEWTRSLEQKSGRSPGSYNVMRDAMRDAAPDWEVPEQAWNRIAPCLQLPDPDDVHILSAAIAGHADCIVTANLKDFPGGCAGAVRHSGHPPRRVPDRADGFGLVERARRIQRATSPAQEPGLHAIDICRRP